MANAGKSGMGSAQGKGDGGGAMTEIQKDEIGENMVLSNRDKAQHPEDRGQDSKAVEADQYQDADSNKLRDQ